jgi:2'-5' RNA ligase
MLPGAISADQTGAAGTTSMVPPPARVFVGIKVAPEIAGQLVQLLGDLHEPSVRPVAPSDMHLTLVPPWREASIPEAIEKLRLVAGGFAASRLTFRHIGYGPQPRFPRLIWVDCTARDEIAALHATLLQAYGQTDDRPFHPHVTLARIRGDGRRIARKHPIDQDFSLTQCIQTVELFRSPIPGETGYRILASVRLGEASGTTQTG